METRDELDKIISEFEKEYREKDNSFLDELTRPYYRGGDGFSIFAGKTIFDYYSVDIDPREKHNLRIIETKKFEKFLYSVLPEKLKNQFLKSLNKKYLKQKDELLESLVTSQKIVAIESRTKRNEKNVFNILKKLDAEERTEKTLEYYSKKYPANRILIGPQDFTNISSETEWRNMTLDFMTKNFHGTNPSYMSSIPLVVLECDPRDIKKILEYINRDFPKKYGGIYSEMETLVYLPEMFIEQDRKKVKDTLWNLKNIGADKAHNITRGNGIKVGIIDTGADYTHPEISSCFSKEKGYNFVDNNEDPKDGHSHGTHVSGTVAGVRTGVAPEVQLYALKVLNDEGFGSSFDVLRGVEWSIKHNLDVINLSLGSAQYSQASQDIYLHAYKNGINVVAAAGNDGNHSYNYPAAYEGVISIPAVDKDNRRAYFSNINDMNDIAAPGVSIYSCVPGNKYDIFNGTSMATPHITGSCALVKSIYN